ncbi:unnamed protein product [Echinostoma caproni]|uniref:Ovule protein n=1 Tax=Echinostoma caproni TaxID=27848 RepID=A0A183AD23_9TREM|nr:unnamed protein product [Echinostoma caproni]
MYLKRSCGYIQNLMEMVTHPGSSTPSSSAESSSIETELRTFLVPLICIPRPTICPVTQLAMGTCVLSQTFAWECSLIVCSAIGLVEKGAVFV